jgi:hypothetical protein
MSRPFKFAYMQSLGTFDYKMLVSVGHTAEELEKVARKLITKKLEIQKVWDGFKDEDMAKYMACRGWCDWYIGGQSILWLREWGNEEFRDILNHEVVHEVDFFYQHTSMDGMETRAYLQDYLFREIRTKLSSELKKHRARYA